MTLRRFKDVARLRGVRKRLREDIHDGEIDGVKVVMIASNAPSVEKEIGISEFIEAIRSIDDDSNLILTAISF
jgi:hypothetical protein